MTINNKNKEIVYKRGIGNRFRNSYELVKLSFSIIKKDKNLIIYNLISALMLFLIVISFFIISFFMKIFSTKNSLTLIIIMFIYYFVLVFVGLFFNAAIILSLIKLIKGEKPTFWYGIKYAFKNLNVIFIWSFIVAIVDLILRIIENALSKEGKGEAIAGSLLVSLLGASWNILTFFTFPIMLLKKKGVKESMKESVSMIKKGFGEYAFSFMGVGAFFGLLIFTEMLFAALIYYILIQFTTQTVAILVSIGLGVILISITILVSSTLNTILKGVLYVYLDKGELPAYLEDKKEVLDNSFYVKRKKRLY